MVIMKFTKALAAELGRPPDIPPDAIALTLSCEANALGELDERFLEFVVQGKNPKEEFRITFDAPDLPQLRDLADRLQKHYEKGAKP